MSLIDRAWAVLTLRFIHLSLAVDLGIMDLACVVVFAALLIATIIHRRRVDRGVRITIDTTATRLRNCQIWRQNQTGGTQ